MQLSDSARNAIRAWLSPGTGSESGCKTAAVLTCVAAPLPTDAFRPSYCDTTQKIYCADSIRWDRLPNLPKVSSMTVSKLREWSGHFYSSPWLDACFFGFDAPTDYMTHYSAETGRAVGIATLFLACDFTQAQKDSLMTGLLQYGIDLWGIVRGCNASRGWPAHGGHGTGRKWAMMFSGIMLNDPEMTEPTVTYPELRIGEDMQTLYDSGWTGATVVYAGHQGVWNGEPVSTTPGWGPYEHLLPSQWYCCESGYTIPLGEGYRRCCTSHAWIGEALAVRIMHAEGSWDHPAFFDYVDRWMTEEDSSFVRIILQTGGWDFTADWEAQGAAWDNIVNDMWAAYRNHLPSPAIEDNRKVFSLSKQPALNVFPNPFNPTVVIRLLNAMGPAGIDIFSVTGARVATFQDIRDGKIVWNAGNHPSGLYLVKIRVKGQTRVKRIQLIK